MAFIAKNKEGKVTHILGVEAELVAGLLLLGVGALGVAWVYLDYLIMWLKSVQV